MGEPCKIGPTEAVVWGIFSFKDPALGKNHILRNTETDFNVVIVFEYLIIT